MNRVLLAIGGLLVGLLATLFAAPAMVDWNRYRGIFEEEATRFLGREVRVGGEVNLRLLPVPFVRFERVRVADTTASVGRPLFMADDFTIWLSVGALLSGGIEASDIEVRRPTVTLVLDGKGGGNWSSLSPESFRGSFIPARVVFDAVRISDGTLDILGPDGVPKTSFQNINGELSAQALEGPYRVAAAFAVGGAPREIRLSTAKPAQGGSVRFKGTVRAPESGVSYSLEGDATDVLSNIKVAGDLTARLPLPASLAAQPQSGGVLAAGAPKPGGEFDLRAALKGDTKGFTLTDLALSFEQEGRPQLATGGAQVQWAERTDVTVNINSHWLDLDKISGAGTGGSPLELAQGVAVAVSRILATEGRTEATLTVDQATLGGDVVSNLAATLEHTQGRLNIKSLTAGLPGGARLVTSGAFEGTPPDLRYSGRMNLRGASVTRFAGWLARDSKLALPARDGPFTVVGDLSIGSREVAGRNLTLEIGRNMLTGDASWKAGQPQQIGLNLEGSELDLTPLVPAGADPAQALRDLIGGLAGVKGQTNVAVGASDADIKLRLDRLVVGAAVFRDTLTELRLAGGNLSMPQLRLASAEGYAVELRGDIADLARPAAKGALTGLVTAETASGLAALARLAGLPSDLVPAGDDAAVMTPLRLAGRLQVGLKGPDTHDLSVDGLLAQSRIAGTLRLGKSQAGWRDRPTDIAMTLEGDAVRRVVSKAIGKAVGAGHAGVAGSGARLTVRGIGSPQTGMAMLAAVDGVGLSAAYRGRVLLDDQASLGLQGEIELALADVARGLALGGIPQRPGLEGPVSGTVQIERTGGRLKLTTSTLRIAGVEAGGEIAVEAAAGANRVTGDVKLDKGSLQGLFAVLTSGTSSERRETERRSPWTEAPLDLSVVDPIAGSRLQLQIARLALAPGLEIGEARLELVARPGGLDVRVTDGKLHGGQVSGIIALEKVSAGVQALVEGMITGLRLEKVVQGAATASGGLSANLKLQSTALSPRGLVVALAGGGEVRLTQARLNRWTPTAVASAAETVLALKGEIPPGALRAQLELAMQAEGIGVGSPRIPITVADGALRSQPLVVNLPLGRLTGRGAVDLDHMLVDGEWRMEPRNSPQVPGVPLKPELPAVTVSFTGPLAAFSTLTPKLDMEALEREVAVRKVEREVIELERLRKLDEDRAKNETLRQEAERQLAERQRLEAIQQGQQGGPQARPTESKPASGALPPHPPTGEATGQGAAASAQTNSGQLDATQAQSASSPPAAVEPSPLPRPAPTSAPPKAKARNPFKPFQEGSP